jgi:sigma-B regulation protein RsbU (phosphoserine phosphatase)
VALGDVSGKGAPAALLTAAVQGMFTVEADIAAGPAGTIAKINRGLKQRNIESKFVTMFFGVLSADGSLVYCNGGHNAPVLLSRGGVSRLETGGMILGTVLDELERTGKQTALVTLCVGVGQGVALALHAA